jgi:hypothetical protein
MKILILITALTQSMTTLVVFDFNSKANLKNWNTVNDTVMGGKSSSKMKLDQEGNGVFEGQVSLKNNGGFSSARLNLDKKQINNCTKIGLKLKGDGKKYQFRIKANSSDYYSYTASFNTSGNWEYIEIPISNMTPTYRGRQLDKSNFSEKYFEQISLFIGNKKEEKFKLIVKKIELK